jgi:hypothetical protein
VTNKIDIIRVTNKTDIMHVTNKTDNDMLSHNVWRYNDTVHTVCVLIMIQCTRVCTYNDTVHTVCVLIMIQYTPCVYL